MEHAAAFYMYNPDAGICMIHVVLSYDTAFDLSHTAVPHFSLVPESTVPGWLTNRSL